jgi:hypothetical protein
MTLLNIIGAVRCVFYCNGKDLNNVIQLLRISKARQKTNHQPRATKVARGFLYLFLFTNNITSKQAPWGGGGGWARRSQAHYTRAVYFFYFFLGGWARRSRAGCDKLSQRHYVTLTQHIAVRGYVTLTRGSRVAGRGSRLVIN